MWSSRALGLSLALSVMWTGCEKQGASPPSETSLNADEASQPHATASPGTWETSPAPPAFVEEPRHRKSPAPESIITEYPLSDDQIVVVATTLDEGELAQAKLAQTKAKDPRVKELAAKIISRHSETKEEAETLVKQKELKPASSATSAKLEQETSEQLADLTRVEADEFDRAYADAQVKRHQEALRVLDEELIPNATPSVKAQLMEQRKTVEEHLRDAKELQSSLARGHEPAPK